MARNTTDRRTLFSARIQPEVLKRLEAYHKETGVMKHRVVEMALTVYFDAMDKQTAAAKAMMERSNIRTIGRA